MNKEACLKYIQSTLCNSNDKLWTRLKGRGDCADYCMVNVLLYHRNISVTDLSKVTSISVPAASQQLKTVEETGIVTKERCGQSVWYELKGDGPYVSKAISLINSWIHDEEVKETHGSKY